jgi:hypothetical protein
MKTVRIQVIKVYDVQVEAATDKEAVDIAERMSSLTIEKEGKHQHTSTDFAEVVDWEEE